MWKRDLGLFCMVPEDRTRIKKMVAAAERWICTLSKVELKGKVGFLTTTFS